MPKKFLVIVVCVIATTSFRPSPAVSEELPQAVELTVPAPEHEPEQLAFRESEPLLKLSKFKYSSIAVGLGVSAPIDCYDPITSEIIVNWKWFNVFFHDREGMGFTVNSRLTLGRVTFTPLALGIMLHYDGMAYEIIGKSKMEWVTPVVLEIRATERVAIRLSATWHWPNFFTAYAKAKSVIKQETLDYIDRWGDIAEGDVPIEDVGYPHYGRASDVVEDAYNHAWRHPRIGIGLRWYLF